MKKLFVIFLTAALLISTVACEFEDSNLGQGNKPTFFVEEKKTPLPIATPTEAPKKETAYTGELTGMYAEDGNGSVYEFIFEKGELVTVYYEGKDEKNAWGKDCWQSLATSEFRGMILEEIKELLEGRGFTCTVNDNN